MKKFKVATRLTLCALLMPITVHASLAGADCQTISFNGSQYDELWGCPDTPIESNFVMIATIGEKMGLVNAEGEIVLPIIYDSVKPDSYEKIIDNANPATIEFSYKGNGVAGVINGLGDVIIPEHPSENSILGQLMLSKTKDGKSKLTHLKTHQSAVYDHVFPLTLGNDKVPVNNLGKWGMVNIDTMQVEIPFIYQQLFIFDEGTAVAKLDGNFGIIDENNKIIVPFIYKSLTSFYEISRYPSPVAIASPYEQSHFVVLNKNNETIDSITKPTTDAVVNNFTDNLLAFEQDDGRTGVANWQGKILFEPEEGYKVLFINEEYILLETSSNAIKESEATEQETKPLWYQYDKKQGKLTFVEMD